MKKILVIGASILQLPAIKKAKELGYYTGVIDYNENAIGVKYADEFFNVSTIDINGVVEVAKNFKPNGIVTLATDMPVRSIAAACKELNLPGISIETSIKATDKGKMIKAFEEHNVEHPWFYIIDDEQDLDRKSKELSYPCIMKPTDNSGSRGVVLIHSHEELLKEYNYSLSESRNGKVIIEEYMTGSEVSVEIMVIDGEPHVLQVTDKITTGWPHFVEMGHIQPSRLEKNKIDAISDLAVRSVLALGINCGPAHVEIMLTDSGPKMIELGARMGGDCITSHLVPLSTGIDMMKATIEVACGRQVDIERKFDKGSAIKYLKTEHGIIDKFEGIDNIKKNTAVKEISLTKQIGDTVNEIKSSIDRVGFIIVQADNANEADKISEDAINSIKVVVR